MKNAKEYADIIMFDDRERIVSETPDIFESEYIRRIYEFADGAIVHYEWQGSVAERGSKDKSYNHQFTLVELPKPNPKKFKKGLILLIDHP